MSDQQDAHARLLTQIHTHAGRGHVAPCLGRDGHKWIQDDASSHRHAVEGCQKCPVIEACAEYALDHKEKSGTWGAMTPAHRDEARWTVGREKARATHRS